MFSLKSQIKVAMISALTLSVFVTGCAKKSFVIKTVDDKVAPIDKKVTDLSAAVKDNGERIDAVDRRATQGITAATTAATAANTAAGAAQTTANQANTAAGTAQTTATQANTAAATANQAVTVANTRITAVDARVSGMDRYNPGPIQTVLFKVNSSVLSDDAKKTLDGVAGPVASLASGYQVEIQGFASAEGSADANTSLSQARALAVQRYLVGKGVALIRMSILGVGPVGTSKTKAEREQNRKVEVRVFRAG
jgi:outer membrane protein OmpA-like peptidoglycan-associated protein